MQLVDSSKFVPVELEKVKVLDADREGAASKLSPEDLLITTIKSSIILKQYSLSEIKDWIFRLNSLFFASLYFNKNTFHQEN